jgi:predicted transcriptional regulator of viral defense system
LRVREGHARALAHRLVRKGWFERLRSGVFQLIPAERGLDAAGDSSPFLDVKVFLHPCFYSFGTACSYYGFTEQAFAEMYVVSSKPHRPEEIGGRKYIFAFVSSPKFIGFEKIEIFGRPILMATPERALLDAIERPEYAGGLPEVSRIVAKAAPKIDWKRVVELARRWKQSALIQKLGFLLDIHGINIPDLYRDNLKSLINPNNKIYLARRGRWKAKTQYNPEWFVIENIPRELLLEGTLGKRRFVFKKKSIGSKKGTE